MVKILVTKVKVTSQIIIQMNRININHKITSSQLIQIINLMTCKLLIIRII